MAGEKVICRQCGAKIRLPLQRPMDPPEASAVAPAEIAAQPSAPATYLCSVCQQPFGYEDVYDQQGAVICKNCLSAQQAEAASEQEPIICASCGSPVLPDQVEESDGRLMCASCALIAAAQPARVLPPKKIQKKSNPALWWIVGGSVAALALIAIALMMRSGSGRASPVQNTNSVAETTAPPANAPPPTPTPTPSTAPASDELLPRLVRLFQDGRHHESVGNLDAAAATYQQIIDLGEHDTNPQPDVQTQIDAARTALAAVKERLAVVMSPSPATAPATSSAVVAATQSAPQAPPIQLTWEQEHAARIRQLLAQADARMADNDPFKAALIYQQLFALVGPHLSEIADPELRRQVTSAATLRGKLLVQLKNSPESVSMTADTLLASGLEALQEKHWQAGLEALSDVRVLFDRNVKMSARASDPKYLMALHGMAVAYLKLNEAPRAGELFDDSAPLGQAADRLANREIVINRAALDIIQRTRAMRAAKLLTEWLTKHPSDQPDEDLLNILGTALFIADQHTSGKSMLEHFAQIYQQENERLEQTRPGEKRWGVEWMSAPVVDQKMAERTKALSDYAQNSRLADSSFKQWQDMQGYYNTFTANGARRASLAQVQSAERAYNAYSSRAEDARKRIPDMTWLTEVEPVLPPLPPGMTAVAVAPPAAGSDGGNESPSIFTIPNVTLHDRPAEAPTNPTEAPPAAPVHISVPRYALAFPIDKTRLISSADVVGQVEKVRLQDAQGQTYTAHVVARQEHLALLELDPGQGQYLTCMNLAENFSGGAVTCVCVPQESVFGPQPVSVAGQAVAPPREVEWAVSLTDHPRLAGSPLLDAQGQVVGMVIAKRDDSKTHLPAISVTQLREFLSAQSALPERPSARPDPMSVLEVTVQEN